MVALLCEVIRDKRLDLDHLVSANLLKHAFDLPPRAADAAGGCRLLFAYPAAFAKSAADAVESARERRDTGTVGPVEDDPGAMRAVLL